MFHLTEAAFINVPQATIAESIEEREDNAADPEQQAMIAESIEKTKSLQQTLNNKPGLQRALRKERRP